MAENGQVKSKQRVSEYAEVFTAKREVDQMLDLVKQETERIDSRFLEPACGTGNFLAEVLERKLAVVENRYKKSQLEYEKNSLVAISGIYGIDILEDNVNACRDRLLGVFTKHRSRNCKTETSAKYLESVEFILGKNIIYGDALDLTAGQDKREPIVFSEWAFLGNQVKRRDFKFEALVNSIRGSLFSDLGDEAYISTPIREFPLVHYLEISKTDYA